MRTNTGSYLGLHPAAGIATVREKDCGVGSRRRAGRRLSYATARARSAKGTTVALLDGAARGSSRTRAPARGAVAAPPPPLPPLDAVRCCWIHSARMREKGRERMRLGLREPRPVGVFDPPRSMPGRWIQIDGQRCFGPNRAQAGCHFPGPSPGCGLGAGRRRERYALCCWAARFERGLLSARSGGPQARVVVGRVLL